MPRGGRLADEIDGAGLELNEDVSYSHHAFRDVNGSVSRKGEETVHSGREGMLRMKKQAIRRANDAFGRNSVSKADIEGTKLRPNEIAAGGRQGAVRDSTRRRADVRVSAVTGVDGGTFTT